MYATDFEYDGRRLSDYGFIICAFDGSSGINIADNGYKMTFNKVKRNYGKKYGLTNIQYEDCLQSSFQICKDPEECDMMISPEEYNELMRWLSRREFLKFRVISEHDFGRPMCWFNASFNVKKILIADKLYGLDLTMETNSPFGYGPEFIKTFNFSAGSSESFVDMSDDVGFVYPDLVIRCLQAGTLTLTNDVTGSQMTIKNCLSGEVITVHGDTMIVSSSVSNHKIYDDFNFEFLSIGNTFGSRTNTITSTLPCTIELRYSPPIKDIP